MKLSDESLFIYHRCINGESYEDRYIAITHQLGPGVGTGRGHLWHPWPGLLIELSEAPGGYLESVTIARPFP